MDLSAIYKSIPASDHQAADEIGKQLVAGGPATVEQLVGSVGDKFGDSKGVMPTYALHGLVVYASRPEPTPNARWWPSRWPSNLKPSTPATPSRSSLPSCNCVGGRKKSRAGKILE